jgi:hypothetical protein
LESSVKRLGRLVVAVVFRLSPCLGCLERVEWIGPPLEASNRPPTYGGCSLQEGILFSRTLGTPVTVCRLQDRLRELASPQGRVCVASSRGRMPGPSAGPPVRACLHPVCLATSVSLFFSLPPAATGVGLLVRESRSLTPDWSGLPRTSLGGRRPVSWDRSPLACHLPGVPSPGPSCAATAQDQPCRSGRY